MNPLHTKWIAPVGFRRAILLGLMAALLMGITVVGAVTSSYKETKIRLSREAFTSDPDVYVKLKGVKDAGGNLAAVGDTLASAVEMDTDVGGAKVRNVTSTGNLVYKVEVREAQTSSFQAGERYKIDVYGNDGVTTTLLATLYLKQDVVDDNMIEGGRVEVDVGSPAPAYEGYNVIVTQVQ